MKQSQDVPLSYSEMNELHARFDSPQSPSPLLLGTSGLVAPSSVPYSFSSASSDARTVAHNDLTRRCGI